jgi:ribulose-phosphate 3-epimerase
MLKDVHLMIEDPETAVEEYVAAGADMVTVHIESTRHVHRVLQMLAGAKSATDSSQSVMRGLALNPGTPVEMVEPFLNDVELILLLSVNPGWSGQQFIPSTEVRLVRLRRLLRGTSSQVLVGVDGGVTSQNIASVAGTGADVIVAGRACFDGGRLSPLDV